MTTHENDIPDPVVFEKIVAPLEAKLKELSWEQRSGRTQKLTFEWFVKVLLFRIFAQIKSLRTLRVDLASHPGAVALKLPQVGLSTLHDGFARFEVKLFARLSHHLATNLNLGQIAEVAALRMLWCVDSSFWPVVTQLGWLRREGIEGVRLHLGLALGTLCPAIFVMTDTAPTVTERACFLQMLEAGITGIADRGYVDAALYVAIQAKAAFFVIRQRNNLSYQVIEPLQVVIDPVYALLLSVTDQMVVLTSDTTQTRFRLVHFVVAGHTFRLLTNRFDLTTQQLIVLYAWRWQVEVCQTQPIKMTWDPLRYSKVILKDLRGRVKR